ncbi:MAG: ABC transporter permease [Vicinamibacteria bacterium]|nr:ABC transporter permease [Vicinamibacteria bacterium]
MGLYKALLYLFPKSFRLEYADEMRRIFTGRLADAAGNAEVLSLWMETLLDVIPNALMVHLDILRQDLRFTARSLGRAPGFTLTAIVVAALGVGATTAAFSVTDRVLIRPLPFAQPERLVKVWESVPGYSKMEPSPANYRDWLRMTRSFDALGAYTGTSMNLIGGADPMRIQGAAATANLLPILGVPPLLGRLFNQEEEVQGAAGVVVLSYGLWQDSFGGREDVLGQRVRLDEAAYTVIGVMPPQFAFPDRATRIWTPLTFDEDAYQDRNNAYLRVVGRLKNGVTLGQVRAEMALVTGQIEQQHPQENSDHRATVHFLGDEVPHQARLLLLALFGASLCVLMIACTNLASLLIARSLHRRKELAVRTALGAGRERLIRQLITESLALAVCGGLLGVALAASGTPLLAQLAPTNLPLADTSQMDLRVLAFAALITVMTGVAFGVLPALRVSGDGNLKGLREGARGGIGGPRKLRSALVFAEIAISVVLLVSSGLLVRALWRIQQVDPGFRSAGVLTLRTSLSMSRYAPTETRARFYDQVLSEIRALPGVASAAYSSFLPMTMRGGIWPLTFSGRPPNEGEDKASVRFVTPQLFETLGVPLRQGRDVNGLDTRFAPAAAVVSESFARRYWPDNDPIGRIFNVTFQDRIVVGVVGDIRVRGLERTDSEPQVYLPYQQVADGAVPFYAPKDLAIRSSLDSASLLKAVREILRRADPEVPISDVRTLGAIVEAETSPRSAQLRVLGAFALIAILLAGIGIHGLLAFGVSTRLQEIAVRIALGAARGDILRLVVRDGAQLAVAGVAVGAFGAYAAGRGLAALLAGVSPADLPTFMAAAGIVGVMTLLGSLLPALRAVRVNPTAVMRSE